jgi:release factor glutamine methyltransferase
VSRLNLTNQKFLEIGSGSGLISLLAYQNKAIVSCCDINEAAVECTKQNFSTNFGNELTNFSVYQSDLFDSIPETKFDIIVINPPYFFEEITSQDQLAWNCGKNGEYFSKLFSQLDNFIHPKTNVFMILGDNSELDRIKNIAGFENFSMTLFEQKKIKWEMNFIFKITPI